MQKLGVLSLLDEECQFPKGSDETFLEKVSQRHGTDEYFSCKKSLLGAVRLVHKNTTVKPHKKGSSPFFTIAHYAGSVDYQIKGFLEKNKVGKQRFWIFRDRNAYAHQLFRITCMPNSLPA